MLTISKTTSVNKIKAERYITSKYTTKTIAHAICTSIVGSNKIISQFESTMPFTSKKKDEMKNPLRYKTKEDKLMNFQHILVGMGEN